MEDYDFVRRARRVGRIVVRDEPVRVSDRAWRKHGIVRLTGWNMLSAVACTLGVPPARVAAWRQRRFAAAAIEVEKETPCAP